MLSLPISLTLLSSPVLWTPLPPPRLQSNITPVLSPSYQILFENVDRATAHGVRPNPYPLHLKCLAISGLPVDDMPCLEVWDMHGLVFNSHSGGRREGEEEGDVE